MPEHDLIKKYQQILKALDKTIAEDVWQKSAFLKAICNKLQKIRDDFANKTHQHSQYISPQKEDLKSLRTKTENQQEIFVSLYSSQGTDLKSWERILLNLPHHIVSRPIYSDEISVRSWIRSKENKSNEAYVAFFVDKTAILPLPREKMPTDKFGKPLLSLKDRALKLDNLKCFYHQSGEYVLRHGRLVKLT